VPFYLVHVLTVQPDCTVRRRGPVGMIYRQSIAVARLAVRAEFHLRSTEKGQLQSASPAFVRWVEKEQAFAKQRGERLTFEAAYRMYRRIRRRFKRRATEAVRGDYYSRRYSPGGVGML
jgi:hypothetical protein